MTILQKKNDTYSEEEIVLIQKLLLKDFEFTPVSTPSPDELKINLCKYIQHLLNHDFSRLLQGLYRIDVSEEKVKEILHKESPENIALRITELILQRQHQKAITRRQYQ